MTAIKKGFTLIELLIVIAILGVLAVVVLVAINPVQQLARTRDSGRFSSTSQLGRALQAYAASGTTGLYPAAGSWDTDLANEISQLPSVITNSLTGGCATANVQNLWCYVVDGTTENAVLYSELEADSNRDLCGAAADAWAAYDTGMGRGGVTCAEPVPATAGTTLYAN